MSVGLVEGRRLSWTRLVVVLLVAGALVFASLRGWRWFQDARVKVTQDSWFAGYVDVTATPSLPFEEPEKGAGANAVLSFVVAATDDACTPTWGTHYTLPEAGEQLDLDRRIARLHQLGGTPIVSFGGQANTELAVGCTDPDDLYDAYREVVGRYDLDVIDLDIEGAALADTAANERRAAALARLQESADVDVWVTLPVAPQGLTDEGIAVVRSLVDGGVDLAGVNVMTMNYGGSREAGAELGETAVTALESTHGQLAKLYDDLGSHRTDAQLWRALGATPMAGQNDIAGEVFTLADARRLKSFADGKRLGRLSLWSLNRDRECSSNWPDVTKVSDSCSGVDQATGAFARVLADRLDGGPVATSPTTATAQPSPTASATDDPKTSPYPVWDPDVIYLEDQRVVWKQNVYVAKWWTSGDVPDDPTIEASASAWRLIGPVLPGETPEPSPTVPAGTYPEWSAGDVYEAGDRVQLNGTAYVAQWWTQGTSPEAPSTAAAPSPWRALTRSELDARPSKGATR
ncbi:chitinase [Nocardioides nitrophenolicus]|uniref:chitinase n=1 Tax=Nocardioides nitrophenolicus TaxID=60489 RepID=UPI001957153D|nr:carbohydrate-binding protein [Nocardioides nitrophenolicus]MBM7517344.1 chitinase [Nocardioides nitrophenolicus]